MKIRLNEIPEEGRQYLLNRQTSELNLILQDLVGNNAYDVNLYIKPLNSKDFTLDGAVKTQTSEQCSRCGENFAFDINAKLREILIPPQEQDRTGQYAKSSVNYTGDDESISVSEYSKQLQFDLGEFLHEAIAIEVPFNPCCKECSKSADKAYIYDEKMGEENKPNPFHALKGIKLN